MVDNEKTLEKLEILVKRGTSWNKINIIIISIIYLILIFVIHIDKYYTLLFILVIFIVLPCWFIFYLCHQKKSRR
ncbi:hypothetical protein LCGC14_1188790 [marine sediment metagenome]|uniref:Uncharacterized protein n=1 Tax=marine sediment metagenome TaxID=412755 RepID=A0A0F9P2S3_9ZZZZ